MRVLAIGAHPDDIEIACSGTLAKCVKRGDKVIVCHASTGNLGHVIIPPDELTKIRKKEAEKAGGLAGIEVIGGMFDGSAKPYEQNISEIREMVKIAHAFGASIEGEIGYVGEAAHGDESLENMYATVEETKEYLNVTGVDALAVAIGSAHGVYKSSQCLI